MLGFHGTKESSPPMKVISTDVKLRMACRCVLLFSSRSYTNSDRSSTWGSLSVGVTRRLEKIGSHPSDDQVEICDDGCSFQSRPDEPKEDLCLLPVPFQGLIKNTYLQRWVLQKCHASRLSPRRLQNLVSNSRRHKHVHSVSCQQLPSVLVGVKGIDDHHTESHCFPFLGPGGQFATNTFIPPPAVNPCLI